MTPKSEPKKGELSFTLLETVIAIALITAVMMQVVGAQGNVVYFSGYSRNMTQGIWLAKRILSQVEYHASTQDLKDMEIEEKEKAFDDPNVDERFKYSLSIKEWKFPVLDLMSGAGGGGKGDKEGDDGESSGKSSDGGDPMIKDLLKQIFGDHIIKIAYVEVFWPEGAKKNSVSLTYLVTNQRKLDEKLLTMKPVAEQLVKLTSGEPPKGDPSGVPGDPSGMPGGSGTSGTPGSSGNGKPGSSGRQNLPGGGKGSQTGPRGPNNPGGGG